MTWLIYIAVVIASCKFLFSNEFIVARLNLNIWKTTLFDNDYLIQSNPLNKFKILTLDCWKAVAHSTYSLSNLRQLILNAIVSYSVALDDSPNVIWLSKFQSFTINENNSNQVQLT